MKDNVDVDATNPLTNPAVSDEAEVKSYRLMEVVRGRMFCLAHGRQCYLRTTFLGERQWVCPDERHWESLPI